MIFILIILIILILIYKYNIIENFNIISLPKDNYLYENDKSWFIERLDKYKIKINESVLLNEVKYDLNNINKFLLTDVFPEFKISKSKLLKANESIYENGLCYIVLSNHLLFRDDKLYGIEIELYSFHDKKTNKISVINYKFVNYIIQDKIYDLESHFDSNYICNYYKKIQLDRGLSVSNNEFCNNI